MPPTPLPPIAAAADRVRALLGDEGLRLGPRVDAALARVLDECDEAQRLVVLRRLAQGHSSSRIAGEGDAPSAAAVDRAVEDVIRRTRAEALRPGAGGGTTTVGSLRLRTAGPGLSTAGPEPLPGDGGPALDPRPSTPQAPLPRIEPAVGRAAGSPTHLPAGRPSLSTVEVVRGLSASRRRWPIAVGLLVLLAFASWKWVCVDPRDRAAELTRQAVELSRGALPGGALLPLRHPWFTSPAKPGDLGGSVRLLERALALDPTNARSHLELAWLDLAEGRDSDARRHLQEATTYGAPAAQVALGMGMLAFRAARIAQGAKDRTFSLAQAEQLLSQVAPADPGYREAVWNRVQVALARKDRAAARALADAYAALVPNDPWNTELAEVVGVR